MANDKIVYESGINAGDYGESSSVVDARVQAVLDARMQENKQQEYKPSEDDKLDYQANPPSRLRKDELERVLQDNAVQNGQVAPDPETRIRKIRHYDTPEEAFTAEVAAPAKRLIRWHSLVLGRAYDQTAAMGQGVLVQSGQMDYKEYQAKHAPSEMQRRRDQDIDAIENTWDLPDILKWGAQSYRMSLEMLPLLEAGGLGGQAAGGAGAGVAAGMAAIPALAGPQAVVAPGTVALAAADGYAIGAASGTYWTTAGLLSGGAYIHLREMGIPHEIAQKAAAGSGILESAMYMIKLSVLKGAFKGSASQALKAGRILPPTFQQQCGHYLADVAKLTGIGTAAEIMHTMTEYVANTLNGNDPLPTDKDVMKTIERVAAAAMTSLQGSIVITAAPRAAGAAAREVGRYSQTVDGYIKAMIQQMEQDRYDAAYKLKTQQIQNVQRKQAVYTAMTPQDIQSIVQNPVAHQAMIAADLAAKTDIGLDALAGGVSKNKGVPLADKPAILRGITKLARTGNVVSIPVLGVMPVPIPVRSGYKFSGWQSLKNKLFQFAPKNHPANEIFETIPESLASDVNRETFQQEFVDHATDMGNPDLIDAFVRTKQNSELSKRTLTDFQRYAETQRQAGVTSRQEMHLRATERALKFTDGQRMDLYGQIDNPMLREGYETTGYDLAGGLTKDWISKSLHPVQKEVVNNSKKWLQRYYGRLNEGHVATFSEELINDPHYAGPIHRALPKKFQDPFTRSHGIVPGSVNAKLHSRLAIEPVDFVENIHNHINEFEFFNTWQYKARELGDFMNDPRTRRMATEKFGEDFFNTMYEKYQFDVGLNGVPRLNSFDKIMGRIANTYLSGNPLQFFKQSTGFGGMLAYTTPQRMGEAVRKIADRDPLVMDYLRDSNSRYVRKGGFTPEQKAAFTPDNAAPSSIATLNKFLNTPMSGADEMVTTVGSVAIFLDEMNRNPGRVISPGRTTGYAEAVRAADRIVTQHQSTSTASERSYVEQKFGSLGRAGSFLAKQGSQTNMILRDQAKKTLSNPTKENLAEYGRTWLAFRSMQVAFKAVGFGAAVATAVALNDDDAVKQAMITGISNTLYETIYGTVNELPLFKDVAAGAWNYQVAKLTNTKMHTDVSMPHLDMINNAFRLFDTGANIVKDVNGEDYDMATLDTIELMHLYTRSLGWLVPEKYGGGIPTSNALMFLRQVMRAAIKNQNGGKLPKRKKLE